MHKKLKAVAGNPLIAGSIFIFSGGVLANIFNFVFNLLMSRNLSVSDYGTLVSIISIATLLAIPAQAVIPTIVTVAESLFENRLDKKVRAFYVQIIKPFVVAGIILVAFTFIFANSIAKYLRLPDDYLVLFMSVIVLLGYIGVVNVGFLQARLSFKSISTANIISSIIKVVFGFGFVLLGFGLNGAMWGYVISFFVPVLIGLFILRRQLFGIVPDRTEFSYKSLLNFGVPSAAVVFCLNAYISTDIILVKHFFPSEIAGMYAGLSLIGRSIFYITSPITTVMFPLIVKSYNKNEKYTSLLFTALAIVVGSSLMFTILYYTFPDFVVLFFLKKTEYLFISKNIGHFGLLCTLYSIVFLMSYFFLSIRKTSVWKILTGGVIVQAVLIILFHNNFGQIINCSIVVLSFIILYLLLHTYRLLRKAA